MAMIYDLWDGTLDRRKVMMAIELKNRKFYTDTYKNTLKQNNIENNQVNIKIPNLTRKLDS